MFPLFDKKKKKKWYGPKIKRGIHCVVSILSSGCSQSHWSQ